MLRSWQDDHLWMQRWQRWPSMKKNPKKEISQALAHYCLETNKFWLRTYLYSLAGPSFEDIRRFSVFTITTEKSENSWLSLLSPRRLKTYLAVFVFKEHNLKVQCLLQIKEKINKTVVVLNSTLFAAESSYFESLVFCVANQFMSRLSN